MQDVQPKLRARPGKFAVAVVLLGALVVAAGGWALTMDTRSGRQDAKALDLVVGGLIPLLGSVIMLGRDARQRRAALVIRRF